MKTFKYILPAILAGSMILSTSCRDDWSELNQDPSNVTTTDPNYLFTQAVNEFEPSDYGYWFYNANDFFRMTQMGVPTGSVVSTYNEITAGIGLKINIPGVGPLSVDYGIPLTNCGPNGSENGYFTFGVGDMMY